MAAQQDIAGLMGKEGVSVAPPLKQSSDRLSHARIHKSDHPKLSDPIWAFLFNQG